MRLPVPLDERRRRGAPPVLAIAVAAAAVVGGVVWLTGDGDDSAPDDASGGDSTRSAPTTADDAIARLDEPIRLIGVGTLPAGTPTEVEVHGRATGVAELGLAVLTIEASSGAEAAELTVQPCSGTQQASPSVSLAPAASTIRQVLVPVGTEGTVCLRSTAPVDVAVDLDAFVDRATTQAFPAPVRVVDSTADGTTADSRFAAIGVRPEDSTLRVPLSARFDGLADVGALVVSVATVAPRAAGEVRVFAPESAVPSAALTAYGPDASTRAVGVVPIGPTGELCISTTGRTDLVVELLGLVPSSSIAPIEAAADAGCPGQTLFPDRRLVALYGTQRSERLGVLGEQAAVDAADRLEEVAEPWRAGDRPVLPAFELIATLATGTPEDRGVYNIRSSPEFVQEYLDVARRHGFYLILDLQTGQSDFLTEAKYYEEFLREPDVGLALDPEWRTEPPARPRGGFIGTVDAAEVNQVVEYLAQIVAEEDLPEKLLVLHQFEPNMITNRDDIVELPGIAIVLHMDGFGPRPEKLNSYDIVRADPPWNMGLKLFYDEDTDLLQAPDVLGGLFDPIPDVITYQ